MSSYFDRMAQCVNDPRQIVALARDQYRRYLRDISRDCLLKEIDRVVGLTKEFDSISLDGDPAMVIQELHSFAHKLGSARIQLKGRRWASDNPNIAY